MVNFFENHDGLNRFRVEGVSARRNLLANALLLTALAALRKELPALTRGEGGPIWVDSSATDADSSNLTKDRATRLRGLFVFRRRAGRGIEIPFASLLQKRR